MSYLGIPGKENFREKMRKSVLVIHKLFRTHFFAKIKAKKCEKDSKYVKIVFAKTISVVAAQQLIV